MDIDRGRFLFILNIFDDLPESIREVLLCTNHMSNIH